MSMGIAAAGGSGGHWAVSGASGYSTPTAKMSNLYSQIDSSGSGSINKAQFDQAFATKNPPGVSKPPVPIPSSASSIRRAPAMFPNPTS